MIGIGQTKFNYESASPRIYAQVKSYYWRISFFDENFQLIKFSNFRNLTYLKRRIKNADDRWLWEFLTLGGFEDVINACEKSFQDWILTSWDRTLVAFDEAWEIRMGGQKKILASELKQFYLSKCVWYFTATE